MEEFIVHSYYSFMHKGTNKEYMVTCTLENEGIVTTINKNKSEINSPNRLVRIKKELIEAKDRDEITNLDFGMPMRIVYDGKNYKRITDEI
jgi:hypothetical protein